MEAEKLVKQFIKEYNYGPCIMYGTESGCLYVLWEHWKYTNVLEAPKIYLGNIKQQFKLIYRWHD